MHRAWVDFATTGNPGWPPFDEENRAGMRFDKTSKVVTNMLAAESIIWSGAR